jgi:hypothetical protein
MVLVLIGTPVFAAPVPPPEEPALDALFRSVSRSVVRVQCGGELGTGFVFHGPRQVATSFSLVRSGRPVFVTARDGSVRQGRVAAWDRSRDLALIALEEGGTEIGPPLLSARAATTEGTRVAIVTAPLPWIDRQIHGGTTQWRLTVGRVRAASARALELDVELEKGAAGAPVFGDAGQLIGLISAEVAPDSNRSVAVPGSFLLTLQGGLGGPALVWPASRPQGGASLALAENDLWGGILSARLLLADRLRAALHVGYLSSETYGRGAFVTRRTRAFAALDLGYRLSLYLRDNRGGLHVTPALGAMFSDERQTLLNVSWKFTDPACDPRTMSCAGEPAFAHTRKRSMLARPMASLSVQIAFVEVAAAALWNLEVKEVTGQLSAGIVLP